MKITHVNSGEVKFKQKESIINYGDATITTYNLVNCIAIGGRFNYKEGGEDLNGIFFTHESPRDKETQKEKLQEIKEKLKGNKITDIFFFRIEPSQAAKDRYNGGSTTEDSYNDGSTTEDRYNDGLTTEDIISEMISFTRDIFGLEPNILTYSCDTKSFRCGKASISLEAVRTNLETMTINSSPVTEDWRPSVSARRRNFISRKKARSSAEDDSISLFEPNYLKNKDGDTIIQCPICGDKSGTLLQITHKYDCPNKGKKANLSHKPAEGGRRNNKRTTYKSIKKSQRRITPYGKLRSK